MTQFSNICALIFILMFIRIEIARRKGKNIGGNMTVLEHPGALAWGILLTGFVAIRLIGLDAIPAGINQDEAMGAVDALALSMYGTDRFGTFMPAHFTAWGYGQMSVLLSYLMVPFIKLFGFSTFTVRLPMLLISLAGAAAVYFWVRDTFGSEAAFITFVFLMINPWHFMQGRWSLDCNAFPHMFIIGFSLLSRGLEKAKYLYISMVFFALCMYSYGVSFYMVPIFLLAACICLMITKKVTVRQVLISVLIYFGISFPIYGTMLINFMKWETVKLPFVTMPYFENSIRSNDILFFSENIPAQLESNIRVFLRTAYFQTPDLIWNAIDDFGTVYKCSLPLLIIGIGVAVYTAVKGQDESKKVLCRLLVIYWACCNVTGCCINSVNVNRINIIFYSHIIFAGMGIYYILKRWKLTAGIVLGIFMLQGILFFNRYFTVWADQMEKHFYSDFMEAVEFAGQQECDYYYITPDTQYDGAVMVSEILTQYALKMDAKYYQGETNVFFGREISYADRFHFENLPFDRLNNWDHTVYVIKSENIRYYHLDAFKIKVFGDYSVAVPIQNANF